MTYPSLQFTEIIVDVFKNLKRTEQVEIIVLNIFNRGEHQSPLRESRTSRATRQSVRLNSDIVADDGESGGCRTLDSLAGPP